MAENSNRGINTSVALVPLTLCYFAVSIFVLFASEHSQKSFELAVPEGGDVENRNEMSTPRSFILPATPAIAYEQESALKFAQLEPNICLSSLGSLGFQIENDGTLTSSARNIVALYEFQQTKGILATGRLDQPTKTALGCEEVESEEAVN